VDIRFRTKKLARTFNGRDALVKAYGARQAKKIMLRVSVLRAAATLEEVPTSPPDRCHALVGDRSGQFAVDLAHPYRLVFRPCAEATGSLTRREGVTCIEIISVEDYH
jgi:proteic killer suppression protein